MPFRHTGPTRATRRPGRLRSGHPHRARCDRPQPVGETPRSAPGVPGEVPGEVHGTDHPAFRSPGPTRRCVFVRNPGRVDCERGTNGSSPGSAGRPTAPDGAGGPATGLGRPPGPGWEQVGRPAIPREHHGVQTVGLGLITTGPSKGPDLVGMGNMHRHSNLAQRLRHQCFISASGFTNRQQRALRPQPTHQLSNASRGVGKASRAIFVHRHVQFPFAHVDPCCRLVHLSPPWSWCDNGGAGTLHTCIAGPKPVYPFGAARCLMGGVSYCETVQPSCHARPT